MANNVVALELYRHGKFSIEMNSVMRLLHKREYESARSVIERRVSSIEQRVARMPTVMETQEDTDYCKKIAEYIPKFADAVRLTLRCGVGYELANSYAAHISELENPNQKKYETNF